MPLSEHKIKLIEIVSAVAPDSLLSKYKENCCIAGSRIVMEVLKKLHFRDVKPITVEANVFNEVYVKKGRTPQSQEEAEAWRDEGAWQVVLGDRTQVIPEKWPGHLALVIDGEYLLDVTIFQGTRPLKQIFLNPILTTIPEAFVKGEDKCGLMYNNCMIVYASYPNDKSYQTAKDWWDVKRSKDIVSEIYSDVKKVIAGKLKLSLGKK